MTSQTKQSGSLASPTKEQTGLLFFVMRRKNDILAISPKKGDRFSCCFRLPEPNNEAHGSHSVEDLTCEVASKSTRVLQVSLVPCRAVVGTAKRRQEEFSLQRVLLGNGLVVDLEMLGATSESTTNEGIFFYLITSVDKFLFIKTPCYDLDKSELIHLMFNLLHGFNGKSNCKTNVYLFQRRRETESYYKAQIGRKKVSVVIC